jgi:peroxiredoxin
MSQRVHRGASGLRAPTRSQPVSGGRSVHARRAAQLAQHRRRKRQLIVGGSVVAGIAALFGLFLISRASSATGGAGAATYEVASPGPGSIAPSFSLPSTGGGNVSLASFRGKTVMLFFQEGIGCESCWQQMKDIQGSMAKMQSAGINAFVTITTNDLGQLRQKVADEGLSTPVLADTDFSVSHAYNANQYGMMGSAADGHTFIVVGPDGRIEWRADYGGPPNYTMYVGVDQLLGDFRAGRVAA